jgi:hypothetical protein
MKNRSQSENLGFYPKHLNIDQRNSKITDIENEPPISSDVILPSEFKTNDAAIRSETNNITNNDKSANNPKVSGFKIFNIFRKKNTDNIDKNDLEVVVKCDLVAEPPRETWSKRLDFLMSIIGFSVDIAGIWRL